MTDTLEIRTSPHMTGSASVDVIMRDVVIALLPTIGFAVYHFGLAALAQLVVATGTCLLTERLLSRERTLSDGSAVVTGLLFGLALPPGLPLWMTALGAVVAVAIGKVLFGGLGCNAFNPALVGRAFLAAAFPAAMTTWLVPGAGDRFSTLPAAILTVPFASPAVDAVTAATPLSSWKFAHVGTSATDLALGLTAGSIGETSAVLILLGGLYLFVRRVANWRIPLAILGIVGFVSAALHAFDPARYPPAEFMLLSGGLMLGAVFMATDTVASPLTPLGAWLYGALIGALTLTIRLYGGMPEGIMYAILLGNAVAPLIDRWIQPRVFGSGPASARWKRPA
jgi:electron transport complex protein RnfD